MKSFVKWLAECKAHREAPKLILAILPFSAIP
jgi:hypothetical protein